tara:strand:- start:48 stop:245 length:198 start_codon:yes stop_codon:yes gene_type:complete
MDKLINLKKEIYELKKENKELKEKVFRRKCLLDEILSFFSEYMDTLNNTEYIEILYDRITEVNFD